MSNDCIWLEVSNVRTGRLDEGTDPNHGQGPDKPGDTGKCKCQDKPKAPIQVQLKGDRGDKELTWWKVTDKTYDANELFRALDTKKLVLAGIKAGEKGELVVGSIRVQLHDSGSR